MSQSAENDATMRLDEGSLPDRTSTAEVSRFALEVTRFHRLQGPSRRTLREALIKSIVRSPDPSQMIDVTLRVLVESPLAGRLDDGIDICAALGPALEKFAWQSSNGEWAGGNDDDHWYILIRALGKSTLSSAGLLVDGFAQLCPEAAVEALGDIGDDDARERLRRLAAAAQSAQVRALAAEILAEFAE